MSSARFFFLRLTLAAGVIAGVAACDDTGTCPAKGAIQPDAACSSDQLQCAYDLATPSAACDGTSTVIPTSCTCSGGGWSCPAPSSCDAGAAADGSSDGGSG